MPRILLRFALTLLWVIAPLPWAVSRAEDDSFLVVVYNVENLFDVDGAALFEDYAPDRYGPAHLRTKLVNIARVLATFDGGRGPDIILFEELEADQTPGTALFDAESFLRQYAATSLAAMLAEPLSADVRDLPAEAFLLKALHEAGLGPYDVRTGHHQPDPTGRTIAHVNATFSRFPIVDAKTHPS
ncbi:MAG: hypothetical protein FJ276_34095, partial [Planctomycetes bacterium]|nr:hypothetical protein [Planctomycetota bacterium]